MRKRISPGNLALSCCILVTSLWVFWGVTEMFHEGWYAPFEWLFFLLPAAISLTLTLMALTWPRVGGWLLIGAGILFYAWVMFSVATRFGLNPRIVVSWFPAVGFLAVIGALFLLDAGRRRELDHPDRRWWRRNLRYILAVGIPLLVGLGVGAEPAIRVANRLDDADYGARLIQANGVALLWAPAGHGWGSGVTWNQLALYGLPPVGLGDKSLGHEGQRHRDTGEGCATAEELQRYNVCRYLSEDGVRLETSWQGHWRMPTTDEVVGSLVRQGKNAGCVWNGRSGKQLCTVRPDKETPLWNPQSPIIYLWTANEVDQKEAYCVTYHGAVFTQPKYLSLGSLGYRCVQDNGSTIGSAAASSLEER
jgi:hypothetical protein